MIKGAFTVPGDGVARLSRPSSAHWRSKGYQGWFVVEAEQDPKVSPPLEMARIGRTELQRVVTAAGYQLVT